MEVDRGMKIFVVIPTYDEKDNVKKMADAVLNQSCNTAQGTKHEAQSTKNNPATLHLLFVDDNSPDGTGDVIEEMRKSEPRIHCLHREKKEGLGRAYVAGFKAALELGADLVIQMDCDFSHDPNDIPRMIDAMCTPSTPQTLKPSNTQTLNSLTPQTLKPSNTQTLNTCPDLVIGSRYVKGGDTPGWPFKRRLISRAGGIFIRTVTGMPLRDPTGGFKCWRVSTLKKIDFTTVGSKGYSFQLEMNYRTWKAGCKIKEIPIVFTDRVAGYSKITPGIATESIKIALKLRFA